MKRNTIFGAASLLVAGAAIGAGAVASGSAMAGSGTPAADENTVEVITATVGDDGAADAFSCTVEGVELAETIPLDVSDLQPFPGAPGTVDEPGFGVLVVGASGEVTFESLPEGAELGEAVIGETVIDGAGVGEGVVGEGVVVSVDGPLPVVDDAELHIIDPADVREGTAEECAGIHTQFEVSTAP